MTTCQYDFLTPQVNAELSKYKYLTDGGLQYLSKADPEALLLLISLGNLHVCDLFVAIELSGCCKDSNYVRKIICQFLDHKRPFIREATVKALSLHLNDEVRTKLEEMKESDENNIIRKMIRQVLAGEKISVPSFESDKSDDDMLHEKWLTEFKTQNKFYLTIRTFLTEKGVKIYRSTDGSTYPGWCPKEMWDGDELRWCITVLGFDGPSIEWAIDTGPIKVFVKSEEAKFFDHTADGLAKAIQYFESLMNKHSKRPVDALSKKVPVVPVVTEPIKSEAEHQADDSSDLNKVFGKWPGDETDKELAAAMKEESIENILPELPDGVMATSKGLDKPEETSVPVQPKLQVQVHLSEQEAQVLAAFKKTPNATIKDLAISTFNDHSSSTYQRTRSLMFALSDKNVIKKVGHGKWALP